MSDDLPEWLRAAGFVPADDTTDWDELSALLDLPAHFDRAVEFAVSLLPATDPWGAHELRVELTDEQRQRLGR